MCVSKNTTTIKGGGEGSGDSSKPVDHVFTILLFFSLGTTSEFSYCYISSVMLSVSPSPNRKRLIFFIFRMKCSPLFPLETQCLYRMYCVGGK